MLVSRARDHGLITILVISISATDGGGAYGGELEVRYLNDGVKTTFAHSDVNVDEKYWKVIP